MPRSGDRVSVFPPPSGHEAPAPRPVDEGPCPARSAAHCCACQNLPSAVTQRWIRRSVHGPAGLKNGPRKPQLWQDL